MSKEGVVRLEDLIDEVRAAVKDARSLDPSLFDENPEIVFVRDPAIIGFIMPADKVQDQKLGHVSKIAGKIGASAGGHGGLVLRDRDIIVGFLPPVGQFER